MLNSIPPEHIIGSFSSFLRPCLYFSPSGPSTVQRQQLLNLHFQRLSLLLILLRLLGQLHSLLLQLLSFFALLQQILEVSGWWEASPGFLHPHRQVEQVSLRPVSTGRTAF